MNSAEDLEKAIAKLHMTTSAETDKRILDAAFVALEGRAPEDSAPIRPGVWRMTVISRMAKLTAVAAVILIGVALFFRGPAAKAVTLAQIYEAVEKVRNACISTFSADRQEPMQKEWVSRTLNIIMFETNKEFVLHDLTNKIIKTKSLSSGVITAVVPTETVLAGAKKRMNRAFGLIPFSGLKDLPETARWDRVYDSNAVAVARNTEVYDLIWTTQEPTIPAGLRTHRWRYFVDPGTNLPRRVEVYFRGASEKDYTFVKCEVATYLTDTEIRALVQDTFGSGEDEPFRKRLSEPEYTGTPEPE